MMAGGQSMASQMAYGPNRFSYASYDPMDLESMAHNEKWEQPAMIRVGNYDLTPHQQDSFFRYRDLVGITRPSNLKQDDSMIGHYLCFTSTRDETENTGLYHQIINEELRAHIWYRTSTWASNIMLALQITLSAAITALGASTDARKTTVITILGAINTVMAAALAFLKAKALPASASQYRDRMKKQKAEIDYMHRAYCIGSATLDPSSAAAKAHDDYNKAHNEFDTTISTFRRAATTFRLAQANALPAQGAKGDATGEAAPLTAAQTDTATADAAAAADAAGKETGRKSSVSEDEEKAAEKAQEAKRQYRGAARNAWV